MSRKRCQKRLFTLCLFNNSQRKQLFGYEGLQHLSVELKHLKPSKAFRPDYYMRVFPPNLLKLIILNVTTGAS